MKLLCMFVVLVLLLGISTTVFAADAKRTGEIVDFIGTVEVKSAEGEARPAVVGMMLKEGDIVRTKSDSWAFLNIGGIETSSVEIEANSELLLSELVIDEAAATQQTLLDLAIGKILITAQKLHSDDSKFQVKTPTSIVGVRGTTFIVEVEGIE